MNKIKAIIISIFVAAGGALAVAAFSQTASYAGCSGAQCVTEGVQATGGDASSADPGDIIASIVNILLFILGAVAVIMIIFGGIKYTTSNGNPEQIKSAKNTIMYAVVGVVVALLAYAIVNFVVDSLAGTASTSEQSAGGDAE